MARKDDPRTKNVNDYVWLTATTRVARKLVAVMTW